MPPAALHVSRDKHGGENGCHEGPYEQPPEVQRRLARQRAGSGQATIHHAPILSRPSRGATDGVVMLNHVGTRCSGRTSEETTCPWKRCVIIVG